MKRVHGRPLRLSPALPVMPHGSPVSSKHGRGESPSLTPHPESTFCLRGCVPSTTQKWLRVWPPSLSATCAGSIHVGQMSTVLLCGHTRLCSAPVHRHMAGSAFQVLRALVHKRVLSGSGRVPGAAGLTSHQRTRALVPPTLAHLLFSVL